MRMGKYVCIYVCRRLCLYELIKTVLSIRYIYVIVYIVCLVFLFCLFVLLPIFIVCTYVPLYILVIFEQ